MPDEVRIFDVEDEETGETIKTVPASELEALKKQIEEKDNSIKSLNEKIEKDIPKGESFRALDKKVQKTEEEKGALESRLEKIEQERAAELEQRTNGLGKKRSEYITARAGSDKELAEKIEFFYGRFAGDALTEPEMEQRVEEATFLAKRKSDASVSFNRGASASGSSFVPEPKAGDFSTTEAGIATAKALGLNFVNKKQ